MSAQQPRRQRRHRPHPTCATSVHLTPLPFPPKHNRQSHHPGWLFKTWDVRSARELAARDFPFMLAAFDSYHHPVQRADAARWMVLYQYGGVYLDTDVECFADVGPSLAGRDLVLNCEGRPGERDAIGECARQGAAAGQQAPAAASKEQRPSHGS